MLHNDWNESHIRNAKSLILPTFKQITYAASHVYAIHSHRYPMQCGKPRMRHNESGVRLNESRIYARENTASHICVREKSHICARENETRHIYTSQHNAGHVT